MFVSVTRLRIRSIFFMPGFILRAIPSQRQAQRSAGFLQGSLLRDHSWTFWTMTVWESRESVLAFMTSGAHKAAMPRLLHWCDEASVVHWEQASSDLPSWEEADQRMRSQGRISKVLHPGPHHADLSYRTPLLTRTQPISPMPASSAAQRNT
jgi:hypothetical protein